VFDPSILFTAFKAHGLLKVATRTDKVPAVDLDVGFVQPSELLLGEMVQSEQIVIEYVTATAVPALALGESITIDSVAYRVRTPPALQGDGTYSRATLELMEA
jgi:hypothetical protein